MIRHEKKFPSVSIDESVNGITNVFLDTSDILNGKNDGFGMSWTLTELFNPHDCFRFWMKKWLPSHLIVVDSVSGNTIYHGEFVLPGEKEKMLFKYPSAKTA